MTKEIRQPIRIDLNEFKLHVHLKNRIQLTLHFNSPSRRFYISVIALIVNDMKRSGRIISIPLEGHLDLLALLNETIGGSAGSSDKENLLPRIYRKWKDALPDLENGPLFKVLGRRKEYDEGTEKTYPFTEAEKDSWANLFEYKGSEENVRLKFAIDKVGATLDDIVIVYGDSSNGEAWERFISDLKEKGQSLMEAEAIQSSPAISESPPIETKKTPWLHRRTVLVALTLVIVGVVALVTWKFYLKPAPVGKAPAGRMALPLPDKPSIAVLPFVNMSDDPKQEYFSEGITEDIITNLSKTSGLFVVSRNSSFLYKGKQAKIQEVARDLGVRHVLEGSVRREGGRVRITAQLIDGKTEQHVWADSYDRELKDIFSVQDEVTRKVVTELAVALTADEAGRLIRRHTQSFKAYDLYLRARRETWVIRKESHFKAIEMSRQVIKLDPNFAGGYQCLSFMLSRGIRLGWSASPREDLKEAFDLAQRAISVDDKFPFSYFSLASVYLMQGKHDDALATMNTGVSIAPNNDIMWAWLGYCLTWVGRGEEAVASIRKSMELNPMYLQGQNTTYFDFMTYALFTAGHYEESISNIKKSIDKFGSGPSRDPFLIASYSMLGRMKEAKESAQQWLKANPSFALSSWGLGRLYKRAEDRERLYEALRKAGLK